jgi:hypothetical protein
MPTCARCDRCRWVCEAHPERPWEGETACGCGEAGAPCPICNDAAPPKMPPGFIEDDGKRPRPGRQLTGPYFANTTRITKTTVSPAALITVMRNQRSCSMHWNLSAVLAATYAFRCMALPILPPMPNNESDSASDDRQPAERETKEQSVARHNCEGWRDRSLDLVDLDQGRASRTPRGKRR